jgi:hypothetical protein
MNSMSFGTPSSSEANFARNLMHKFTLVAERTVQVCAAVGALIFFVSGLVYLCLGHWPVTHLDFWVQYDFCLNHSWLESSLHKHYEHLLFFPSFFWLADLRFFHGDQELLFVASLGLLFLTVALLLIPVWRDKTVGPIAKIIATLVLIVGNFWMVRSNITASGGFNCISSLLMASTALAFLFLPRIGVNSPRSLSVALVVVCAGFVASYSFGIGLAIWPTLLFLAWCLQLPWRSLVLLGIAAVAAILIYQRIPPHLTDYRMMEAAGSAGLTLATRLCRLAGGPFLYGASAWHEKHLSVEAAQSSMLSLWCGGAGLAIAVVTMVFATIRRDVARSSLKCIGMALVTFNLVAMCMVVIGNRLRGPRAEFEFLGPRYLFWTTLFWAGVLLIFIQFAESRRWLRWPVWLVALALPILAFPSHYRSGLNGRWARMRAECAAVSLVNGVRDDQEIRILAPLVGIHWVYRVAEQLRLRRLDMFAEGLQDWIGVNEAAIFGGRHKRAGLQGQCRVDALLLCDNGAPAARIIGRVSKHGRLVPKTFVIADPAGVICGVARSSTMYSESPLINRAFYLSKLRPNVTFFGYIRGYDANLRYVVRSADSRVLSDETIAVSVPGPASVHPP